MNYNNNNKSNISSITDPIITKLLMEGFWVKTTTKTTTSSSSSTTSKTTKQKQQQQQLYPNFNYLEIITITTETTTITTKQNKNTLKKNKKKQQQISDVNDLFGPNFKARFLNQQEQQN